MKKINLLIAITLVFALLSLTYAEDIFEVGGLSTTERYEFSNHSINETQILINRTYHINLTVYVYADDTINYTIPFKYYNPLTIEISDKNMNTVEYTKQGNSLIFNATPSNSPYRIDYDAIVFDEITYSCSQQPHISYDKIICQEKFNNYLQEIIDGNYSSFYNFTNLPRWQERDNQTVAVALNNQPFNIEFRQYDGNYTEVEIKSLEYATKGENILQLEYDIPKNVSSSGGGGGGAGGGTITQIIQLTPNTSVSIRPKLITITPITTKTEDKTSIFIENLVNKPIKFTVYPTTGSNYVKYIRIGNKLIRTPDDYVILDVGETKEVEVGLYIPNTTATITLMFEDDKGVPLGSSKIIIYPVKSSTLLSKFIYPLAFREGEDFRFENGAIIIPSKADVNIPIGWLVFLFLFMSIYNLFMKLSPKIYKKHKNLSIYIIIGATFLLWISPIPMKAVIVLTFLLGLANLILEFVW